MSGVRGFGEGCGVEYCTIDRSGKCVNDKTGIDDGGEEAIVPPWKRWT